MGQEIAYLTAIVGADITSFRRGMSEVRQSLLNVGGLSESLRTTGRNLTLALTVPMGIAGAAALDMAVDFDAAMRNVASISDVVADNFESSSATVLEWGSNIRSGPIAAAEALNTVMQAGFGIDDFNEALLVAQVSAFTAEAGLADLTTTTEALVAALLSYSQGADQAAFFSDVLTRMVQVGVGSMSEFGNSLAQVLPSAATLGVEFDELGGVMAYLTQRGFPASRAATSLANAFNKLITPSEEMNRVWTELGVGSGQELIDTFGGVQGAFNALFEIADESPDAARALAAMFPDERGRRAIQLAMSDVDAFNATMNEFMADVTGATGRAHAEQMQSFAAQFDLMKSAGQELAITIGQQLMPVLLPLVVGIRDLFQSISDTNPALLQLGLIVAGVVAATGPLLYILGTLLTPVGLLAGAVVTLGAAFATNFGGIRAEIERIVSILIPNFNDLKSAVEGFFNTLIFGPTQAINFDTINDAWGNITFTEDGIPLTFWDRLVSAWAESAPEIEAALGRVINDIVNAAIWFAIDIAFPAINDLVSGLINAIADLFAGTENTYKGANSPIFQFLRTLFNGGIGEAANALGSWFQQHFPDISGAFATLFTNIGEWLENEGVPAFGRILGYAVGRIGSLIAELIRGIFSGTGQESPIIKGFREGFVGGLNQAFDDVGITNALDRGVTLIAGILGTLFLGSVFINGISASIIGAFRLIFAGVGIILPGLITAVAPIVAGIGTAIASGIQTLGALLLTAPIGAAIVGVLAGLAIFDLIPQDTRNAIAQAILDAIGLGFLEVDSAEYAARVQAVIADPIARILDSFGVDHGLWELMDRTQDELHQTQMAMIGDAEGSWNPKEAGFVGEFFMGVQPILTSINAAVNTFKANYIATWVQLQIDALLNQTRIIQDTDETSRKLYTAETKIKNDLADTSNTVGIEMQKMKNHFNVQQVTLPTDPFTNALQNLRNAIQPIIDGIIAAWNAMLALVGAGAPAITPPATGGGGGGGGGGSGGGSPPRPPVHAPGGGRALGGSVRPFQMVTVGERGVEGFMSNTSGTIIPHKVLMGMMGNGSGSGTQINNVTIITNNADKLLEDLRKRGIDLKKRA